MRQLVHLTKQVDLLGRKTVVLRVVPAVDLLIHEGKLCSVRRWKACLIFSRWFRIKSPATSAYFHSMVTGRELLIKGGRGLEREIDLIFGCEFSFRTEVL